MDSQFENTKTANAERNPRSRLVLYLKLEIPGRLSFLFGGARQAPQTSDCTTKFLRLEVLILLLFFSFTFFPNNANNRLHLCLGFENLKSQVDLVFCSAARGRHRKPRIAPRNSSDLRFPFSYSSFLLRFSPTMQTMVDCLNLPVKCTNSHLSQKKRRFI